MNKLNLASASRPSDNSSKTERNYIDFVVDEQSLGQLFDVQKKDLMGALGWTENIVYENSQIDEFTGLAKPALETERIPLYVCPECGDISCGAITAAIEITNNAVIWKNFGFENTLDEPNLDDYKEVGPFKFDKNEYIQTFQEIRRQIKS